MKKTFICAALLFLCACTFFLTGCPQESEDEPLNPWSHWTQEYVDRNETTKAINGGRFVYDCSYRFENGKYCSFGMEKRIDNGLIQTEQYYIWFKFEGAGGWESTTEDLQYFDRAYFEKGYKEGNEKCDNTYGPLIQMVTNDGVCIDKVYGEQQDGHVHLSEWLPYNGNWKSGDVWVMKFESDSYSERNITLTIPTDIVADVVSWVDSLDQKTLEYLQNL